MLTGPENNDIARRRRRRRHFSRRTPLHVENPFRRGVWIITFIIITVVIVSSALIFEKRTASPSKFPDEPVGRSDSSQSLTKPHLPGSSLKSEAPEPESVDVQSEVQINEIQPSEERHSTAIQLANPQSGTALRFITNTSPVVLARNFVIVFAFILSIAPASPVLTVSIWLLLFLPASICHYSRRVPVEFTMLTNIGISSFIFTTIVVSFKIVSVTINNAYVFMDALCFTKGLIIIFSQGVFYAITHFDWSRRNMEISALRFVYLLSRGRCRLSHCSPYSFAVCSRSVAYFAIKRTTFPLIKRIFTSLFCPSFPILQLIDAYNTYRFIRYPSDRDIVNFV
uniref:Uncharacterized protein n=1 Tax=Spongospora subterranea TaxID=70186 RepID=A0A0H5RBD1_9EUKA|eukprot:CRZ11116.1 hypothetical protein [Spongospora subterranea]